jgi:hypothetical protein
VADAGVSGLGVLGRIMCDRKAGGRRANEWRNCDQGRRDSLTIEEIPTEMFGSRAVPFPERQQEPITGLWNGEAACVSLIQKPSP